MSDFWRDRRGVTALEYGMIAAACVTAIGASIVSIGGSVSDAFSIATSYL